jgi:hypothetical protein
MWSIRHGVRVAWLCLAVACQERNPAFVGATTGSSGESESTTSPTTTSTTSTSATASMSTTESETASTTSDASTSTGPVVDPVCGADLPPSGGECPGECTGGCTREGECVIDCSGSCADEVVCPEGFACTIACIYGDCQGTTLRCPSEHACRIGCSDSNTCRNATFVCGGGTCAVECGFGGNICRDATLQCGTRDSRACGNAFSVTPVPADGSACACVNDC